MRALTAVALSGALLAAGPVLAQEAPTTAADKLGQCFAWAMAAKDKAVVANWLFAGLSANPYASAYVKMTDDQRKTAFEAGAKLAERLTLDDCRKESVSALKEQEGALADAIYSAFYGVFADMVDEEKTAEALMRPGEIMDKTRMNALYDEAGYKKE